MIKLISLFSLISFNVLATDCDLQNLKNDQTSKYECAVMNALKSENIQLSRLPQVTIESANIFPYIIEEIVNEGAQLLKIQPDIIGNYLSEINFSYQNLEISCSEGYISFYENEPEKIETLQLGYCSIHSDVYKKVEARELFEAPEGFSVESRDCTTVKEGTTVKTEDFLNNCAISEIRPKQGYFPHFTGMSFSNITVF